MALDKKYTGNKKTDLLNESSQYVEDIMNSIPANADYQTILIKTLLEK